MPIFSLCNYTAPSPQNLHPRIAGWDRPSTSYVLHLKAGLTGTRRESRQVASQLWPADLFCRVLIALFSPILSVSWRTYGPDSVTLSLSPQAWKGLLGIAAVLPISKNATCPHHHSGVTMSINLEVTLTGGPQWQEIAQKEAGLVS